MVTRIEAETLTRTGAYRLESNSLASGGRVISFVGSATNETGTARGNISVATGTYDIFISYFDESDGAGSAQVKLGGQTLDSWTLNQNLGNGGISNNNRVVRQIATGRTVTQGELLEIIGTEQSDEHVRIDYIEFRPVTAPAPGVLALSAATYSINENGTPVTAVTVTRTGGSSGAVSATLTPSNGSATAPGDYDSTPLVVQFANGETSKTVTIPVLNDSTPESNETINLTLSAPTGGATLGTQTTATLTIVDNDFPPSPGTLAFGAATYSVNENGTPVTAVTVTRTGGSSGVVSATLTPTNGTATAPGDYDSAPLVVQFANGETSKTVTIPILNDSTTESNETINLTLSAPTNGATLGTQTTATLTIVDNDAPPAPIRIEAETLTRTGAYRLESNSLASAGRVISFVGSATNETGTARGNISVATGTYDIFISYFDESDGAGSAQVKLGGQTLDSWTLNQNLGSNISTASRVVRQIATGRTVTQGELLEIIGTEQSNEHVRIDYIEFRPIAAPTVDTTSPTAQLTASNLTTAIGANYDFTVTYADNVAVDVSGLDSNDIQVTGPNGFSQLARLVGVSSTSNGTPRTATYRAIAADGSWNANENGTYTVSLQADQVDDTSGNVASARTLGTFQINVSSSEAPTLVRTIAVDPRGSVGTSETAEFSPNGQLIAAGAGDGKLRLFRVSDGSLVWETTYWSGSLTNKQGEIEAVYFSPDGQTIAASGNAGGTKLYRTSDGSFIQSLSTAGADGIAFSPDGQYFAGPANRDVRLYNPATWALRYSNRIIHGADVNSIDFTQDSQILLSASADQTVKISRSSDGSLIRSVRAASGSGSIKSVRLSPNNTLFATANGLEHVVKVFRVSDGALLQTLPHGSSYMEAVAFSPNGRYLLTGGGDFQDDGADVSTGFRLYRTSDFSLVGKFVVHTQGVEYIDFSSDGLHFITASEDGTVKLWRIPPETLNSTSANDTLIGSAAVNVIVGNPGNDTLTGGAQSDTFVFNTPNDGIDLITNFSSDDLLQISTSGFGGGFVAGTALPENRLVSNSNPIALGSSGTFLYNTSTGLLSFDADGTGSGVAAAIATLQSSPTLTTAHFTLVA